MSGDEDPMVALVESWDTFLVEPSGARKQVSYSGPAQNAGEAAFFTPSTSLTSRTFLSDALSPLSLLDEGEGQALTSPSASSTDAAPSLLWLLTLVSRNMELLRAVAHLVLQFNAQFASLLEVNEGVMNNLRERHQQQLASLLEVADSHTASDMIVDSTVTERVVHQQEQELDRLERQCGAAERQLEVQLQQTLFIFLHTSAPDAMAAANRRVDALDWMTGNPNGSGNGVGADGLYRAEVDVSRFAEIRKVAPRHQHQNTAAVAPFSPLCLVPVRTIKLDNEVGSVSANLASSPTRKRANDVTLQPIILDVSPLSGLTRCLTCCSGTQPGAVSSSVSNAAEEHLLRLAHTRHSVLLLIGTEAAALEVMATCKAPELLLGATHTCRERFRPLPHHPVLRVLFTTRLWGANVVLLWNPSQEPRAGWPTSSSAAAQTVVEDALQLAYAWDADMFSVAVLEGARLPQYPSSDATNAGTQTSAPPSSPAAAFFAGQAMSMEVLRQLRNGVTRELLETAGTRRARCWQGSSAWLQLGGGSVDTAGTHMCPRAVGVLYVSQAAAAAAGGGGASTSSVAASPTAVTAAAASPSPASVSAASSPLQSAASSPTSVFRGPPVTFNTPLAIRAFLPLSEEYFIKDQLNRRGAEHNKLNSSNSGSRDRRGAGSYAGRGAGAAMASGLEENLQEEVEFSHDSFTASSLPRASRSGFGDGPENGGYGDAAFQRERQRETMGLEALIHYAFGEFAEAL
ncbi:hypothetical protein ABB37_03385 [Leptomonas pyrrhocoris]|uniref:Uncharacterized protein n=1 Tax=Leptomonas pyrrhocoris TaxID=157538 RepID=A0A0M9G4V0_LEPPY|nr:hypothetical protein ABB37_03385 [Leptomonas pyrrhocoris]KPA82277.1 hypothetical protein ABB37_03385 [Leptomonas pyrrhocoris]|eukprot:XP_015660716.1 hypothetical protein ABB37_03385 [Leptomonas pyrrhocoris]